MFILVILTNVATVPIETISSYQLHKKFVQCERNKKSNDKSLFMLLVKRS